jgi:tRNA threonylcarbamoyladenosine biosynthesis protein TsaB
MKLLALDTATEACSVALWRDGQVLERFEHRSRHSEHLLVMIDALLAEGGTSLKQLDAIAFGRGPGSFTGLRIGAGVAQGLAFAVECPVVPVSSLAALAQGIDGDNVLAAFDARMQQVYWAAFRRNAAGIMEAVGDEAVLAPQAVPVPEENQWVGAGSGFDVYGATLSDRLGTRLRHWHANQSPRASNLAQLAVALYAAGGASSAENALPVYVRDDVATKKRG